MYLLCELKIVHVKGFFAEQKTLGEIVRIALAGVLAYLKRPTVGLFGNPKYRGLRQEMHLGVPENELASQILRSVEAVVSIMSKNLKIC